MIDNFNDYLLECLGNLKQSLDEVFVISTISRIIKVEVKGLIMNHSHTVHDMITLDFECP